MTPPSIEEFDVTKYPDYRVGLPPDVYKLLEFSYLDEYEAVWGRPWGSPGIGRLREVALVAPSDHEGNPLWMTDPNFFLLRYKSELDIELMIRNHQAYAELLTEHGVDIHWMEFKNAWGAWGPMRKLFVCEEIRFVRGGAILPRFGHASYKRGLEREFQRFLTEIGCPILYSVHGEGIMEVGPMFVAVGPFGLPKVGPDSAASDPGPVCYGRGGTEPTVTDADLALGYLNPDFFLGGEIELDVAKSNRSLARLGESLGLSPQETASAIHRVVNENMANAARMHAIERGLDLRPFTLVATGGAGPVHAWGVAKALGITRVVYPPKAGVASAFGMLTAPPAFEFARSAPSPLSSVDWSATRVFLSDLVEEGTKELAATGGEPDNVEVSIWADVRYQGQGGSITVAVGADIGDATAGVIDEAFRTEYVRVFGSEPPDVEPEFLTWRVSVAGERPNPTIPVDAIRPERQLKGHRPIWITEESSFAEAAVYDRDGLAPGARIAGPAVVEERESTVVIGPTGSATVDDLGNLEVDVNG